MTPAEAKLDWSGLPTLVYANSQMHALARRIRVEGSRGMLPQGNFFKLDALRRLLRPFLGLKTSLEVNTNLHACGREANQNSVTMSRSYGQGL